MRSTLIFTAWLALLAAPIFAQAPPACDGTFAVVRVSEIKPGGSIQGFMAAVAAHKAWYRANGITDNDIYATRVLVPDEKTKAPVYSDKQIMTWHINPPAPARTTKRGDAAWNAYVKMYQDNSTIKTETMTCMPKAK
jgi:hypothetical protein